MPRRRTTYVLVQRYEKGATPGRGGTNEYVAAGDPVRVPCNIYELTSEERALRDGLQSAVTKKLHVDSWPGGLQSRIFTPDGREWDPVGEPESYQNGVLTRHLEITIKNRGAGAL